MSRVPRTKMRVRLGRKVYLIGGRQGGGATVVWERRADTGRTQNVNKTERNMEKGTKEKEVKEIIKNEKNEEK